MLAALVPIIRNNRVRFIHSPITEHAPSIPARRGCIPDGCFILVPPPRPCDLVLKETPVRLLRSFVVLFSLAGMCSAQVPGLYKTVNRVTWVVENIDKVRPAWAALGLSGIEEYPNIQLIGRFRGKAITIYAWQITGHLGTLTVDLIQPGQGQV